jgi:hypothetical protein
MIARIVVEGLSDLAILKALLPEGIQRISELVPVGGRSNLSSIARTLLVKHKEPVAVVMDTDTLDPASIREKYLTMELMLQVVSGGVPFKVIPCKPVIETVFFEIPDILERIFPNGLPDRMLYSKLPKEALAGLLAGGGGPTTLDQLLEALADEDVERMRMKYPIRQLIDFVSEAVVPVANRR